MRAFMRITRPLLVTLNGIANWCLHRVGVEPVDELAAGRNPETLRELVDHLGLGLADGAPQASACSVAHRPRAGYDRPVFGPLRDCSSGLVPALRGPARVGPATTA